MQLRAGCALDTVRRPDRGRVAAPPSLLVNSNADERAVIGRLPVAAGGNEGEADGEPVERLCDLVTIGHRQRTAWAEVVLEVDDQKRVHTSGVPSSGRAQPAPVGPERRNRPDRDGPACA